MASFLFFSLLLVQGVVAAGHTCYGLDGTKLDDSYGACNSSARHSGCCAIHKTAGSVDICLDNGLCMATNDQYMGTIWQAGCTDPTGKDPACPKMCPDMSNDFDNLNPVPAWNIQMCDYGSYCCRAVDDHKNCCNNATAPKVKTTSIGAFQFQTSTARVSAAAATVAATTKQASQAVGTAVSTGEPFSQSTPTPLPRPDDICKKDKSAVVGGAVGGILGAALLGLVGIILWMHKKEKRQRRLKEHYEEQFGQNFAYRRTIIVESDATEDLTRASSEKSIELVRHHGDASKS